MFTKTRRFLIFAVIALACVLLVACNGEPPVVELKAPTEIAIEIDYAPIEPNATSVEGDDIELAISVAQGCDPSVTWASSDDKIATVDKDGVVTPVAAGKVTITATSTKAPAVSNTIELVVQPKNIAQLLKAASDYVKEKIDGGYIDGNLEKTKLPCSYETGLLTYVYKNVKSNEVYKGNYYRPTEEWQEKQEDAIDTIKCTITYSETGASTDVLLTVYVVKDVEENDFNTVFAAREAVEALFKDINKEAYNVEKLNLSIEKSDKVIIQWATSNSSVLKVNQTAGVNTTEKNDDEFEVQYVKPMDNTDVTITATIMSAGNYGETVPITLTAVGFAKEDKVNYFKETTCAGIPAKDAVVRKSITLPTYDSQFGMTATWESSNAAIMSAAGVYTDAQTDPSVGTEVTLTATVLYLAANEENDGSTGVFTDKNSFKEQVSFVVTVYPCTVEARAANLVADYTAKNIADGKGWFPWGKIDRASNQLTGLPATMGDAGVTGEYASVALNWTCSEAGLFDANWNLLKQYLRYHAVTLKAEVTLGSSTETIEVPLNVGIAQMEMTSHIGGSFSRLAVQKCDTLTAGMDALQILSAFDDAVGQQQVWYKGDSKGANYTIIMGANEDLTKSIITQPDASVASAYATTPVTPQMQFGIGVNNGFGGVTLYWDDEDTGVRFQYYTCEAMTWVIYPEDVKEDGNLQDKDGDGYILSMLDRYGQNYDHIFFVNLSGKEVKIPLAYYGSGRQVTYTAGKDVFPLDKTSIERQATITLDSNKCISIIDATGKVGLIESEKLFENDLAYLEDGVADESGNTVYAQYLTIPVGGYAWTACGAQTTKYTDSKGTTVNITVSSYLEEMMCTPGQQLTVEFWNIHPCNTFTTCDWWYEGYPTANGTSGALYRQWHEYTDVYYWARNLSAAEITNRGLTINSAWTDAAAAETPMVKPAA